MKKLTILTIILGLTINILGQSPQKLSYQCVVRYNDALVKNQPVGMRISILQGTLTGPVVYQEIYNPNPQTNANGLVTLEVGTGIQVTGTFSSINWASGQFFLKTEIDPSGGTNYLITGTTQLLSVPFALYATTAGNGFSGNYNDLTNKPFLFDGTWSSLTGKPAFALVSTTGNYTDLLNKPILFSGSYNDLTNKPALFDGAFASLTGKPTTISGYGITDAMTTAHPASAITSTSITNWNTAYGWGNHASAGYVPGTRTITINGTTLNLTANNTWNVGTVTSVGLSLPGIFSVSGSPVTSLGTLTATLASQSANRVLASPSGAAGTPVFRTLVSSDIPNLDWGKITTGKPTTLAGYGITDAMSASHPANSITPILINYWNNAYSWGNHAGLYKPNSYVPNWTEITDKPSFAAVALTGNFTDLVNKPTSLEGYGITNAVNTSGDQSIGGNKTFTGTIDANQHTITNVADPINEQDAATKAYATLRVSLTGDSLLLGSDQWVIMPGISEANPRVVDIQGNIYRYVTIGNQDWFLDNLKATKYNDGEIIPLVTDGTSWGALTTPGYCWYNNDQATYGNIYGAMYNWYAASSNKLCPIGWRVPSDEDWLTLTNYLGGEAVAGGKLKKDGLKYWSFPNTGATNVTGFSALPTGTRYWNGSYSGIGKGGGIWSSSESYEYGIDFYLSYSGENLSRSYGDKYLGRAIRCMREASSTSNPELMVPSYPTPSDGAIRQEFTLNLSWSCLDPDGVTMTYDVFFDGINGSTQVASGINVKSFQVTGLIQNTKYYWKIVAHDGQGNNPTSPLWSFTTWSTVTDIMGNIYKTTKVGNQDWMAENLKTTKLNNGTDIPQVTDALAWSELSTPGYCWYGNSYSTYGTKLGALYNGYAVNSGLLCPTGWHVATDNDWTVLTDYLGGPGVAGGMLKIKEGGWQWRFMATDAVGFSAKGGGARDGVPTAPFLGVWTHGFWWTSSPGDIPDHSWTRTMYDDELKIDREDYSNTLGLSVRCIKD